MSLAIRHRDDLVTAPPQIPGMRVHREEDIATLADLQGRTRGEISRRFASGNRAYVARLGTRPTAWGWVATQVAEIGELNSTFILPPQHRYLWNFVTAEAYRGMGIYPRLLDAIVREESVEAETFWIAYAPENHASAAGIRKAGFVTVADLSFDASGRPAMRERVRGRGAAQVLGLALADEDLAPCWRCAREAAPHSACCAGRRCSCDYQRPTPCCSRPSPLGTEDSNNGEING